jgi:hypothetical protein
MGRRFFAATAMGGRLYLEGLSENGTWEPQRLVYWDESAVEVLVERVVHRKALTIAEVKAILQESAKGLPAIRVWVAEGLEDGARLMEWAERGRSGKVRWLAYLLRRS